MEEEVKKAFVPDVPQDGDWVQPYGAAGPVMLVESEDLGDEHLHEGVSNGILCTWTQDGEERFEIYRQGQLKVVKRAANTPPPAI